MKPLRRIPFLLLLCLLPFSAKADVAVLVHGYLGSPTSWDHSGVSAALDAAGWHRAGVLGGPLAPPAAIQGGNSYYLASLPSTAPAMLQADLLSAALGEVERRHPGEAIQLVGHSAGGVIARLALVRRGASAVTRLITIAAPHLGTTRTYEALDATDGFCLIREFFAGDLYHTVKHSRHLLFDLSPPQPGNLLFWLNGQPHPDIDYISVMRGSAYGLGDAIVPAFSQDMNQVPALSGKSQQLLVPAAHELQPGDGPVVVGLLQAE